MSPPGTILISGANRGLGLGLALEFAGQGWRVFGGCRRPDGATELRRGGVEPLALDVCDERTVHAAMIRVRELAGGLDVLVNNAGINPFPRDASVAEFPLEKVRAALEVNVVGAWRLLQAAVPLLSARAAPRVVNMSSGAGSLTHNPVARGMPAYCVSKAALNMLTCRAARDLPDITVVSISPGWVRTDMGGPDASLAVGEVATALAATITRLNLEHSGQWLDRFGQPSEFAW